MSLTCRTFVLSQREELWKRLERWQNCVETKTNAETYFKICEQLGQDPDPDLIPPELEDFPIEVQAAIDVYNKLGDKLVADIGYLGKDWTAVQYFEKVYDIENKEIFYETILRLDERQIKKSATEMRQARERLKNKK